MGFMFKIIRRGEFSYYLKIRGNIIVYINFVATTCDFYFINNVRISKKRSDVPPPPHITTHTVNKHTVHL